MSWPVQHDISSGRGRVNFSEWRFIGAGTNLPPTLVRGLWEQISPVAEQWRAIGVYGPEVVVPAEASLQDRLLGLTGRQPA